MKFVITYLAGILSTLLVLGGFISGSNMAVNLIFAVMTTVAAALFCHKRHMKKRDEYYNRFRSKNDY